MLELENVHAFYDQSHVLHGISIKINQGEVVTLLGRNGAGKTTTTLAIMGYLRPDPGKISFLGNDISRMTPYQIARGGIGFVPQEREVFPSLTTEENLTVAARRGEGSGWDLRRVYGVFPRLKERSRNFGAQLSGGEQQMLAIARALMLNPRMMLIDEPSEGLAPLIVKEIIKIIEALKNEGLAILLVEQNLKTALTLGDRHIVLSKGEICFVGTSDELEANEAVKQRYLSI